MRPTQRSLLRLTTSVLTVGALTAALGGCTLAGSEPPADDNRRSVTVGFMHDVHAANVWTMDECESDTLRIELSSFKQFAEIQRGLEQGQVDAAMMGYQNLGQMLDNGFEDFRAVSGVYRGGEHITVASGSSIERWDDLRGARIGIPPNSFVEMLFRASLRENGVDVADMELVPFAGAGPPLQTALRNGDVDAMVAWEPNGSTAVTEGYGVQPPFDIQNGALGDATALLYVTEQLAAEDADVTDALVDCLQERTEALGADVDAWVEALRQQTGLSAEVSRTAIETGEMDLELPQASAENIIAEFADNGLLDDTSDRVSEFFDYGPLERVTGRRAADLGATE
ncbi:NitT/TauT family transport system substrate-binding protein [Prauserella aidingensis]|uniref:ABC transporter substrate-binding protein n=1 Tax=Prauserella aidingensis TaxID=387890 RepID=UPI0020A300BA|nr:ABC transporter substrate-binding protein [Prauserella aidingensis]MCP2253759.1 NitT/TauT family transport system substrate-binding protein [Prauserella aidingensis]